MVRDGRAVPELTTADLGASETIPTLRDSITEIQPTWTDLTTISPGPNSEVRLALPLSLPLDFSRSAGRTLSIDAETGRKGSTQTNLDLDNLYGDTSVQALCFDPIAGRLFAFGDQRRGGRRLPRFGVGPESSTIVSSRGAWSLY